MLPGTQRLEWASDAEKLGMERWTWKMIELIMGNLGN